MAKFFHPDLIFTLVKDSVVVQGCQIFLGTTYQNGEKIYHIRIKYTKWPQNVQNGHKIYKVATKFTKWPQNIQNATKNTKWPPNIKKCP
jgi:hypothetical protein